MYHDLNDVSRNGTVWAANDEISTLKLVRGRFGGLEKLRAALEILPHSAKT